MASRLIAVHQLAIMLGASTCIYYYWFETLARAGLGVYYIIGFPIIPLIIQLALIKFKFPYDTPIYYLTTH